MKPGDKNWCPPYRYSYRYSYGPWRGHGWGGGPGTWGRPPRHWFFMRVLFFFFWICVVLTVSFYLFGGLSGHRVLHTLAIVLIIMLLGGMILRRMFSPLRWLMRGVQEISNGNLDFQFPSRGRHGEIWYLAEQFNQMVGHVKEMIHSKEQLLLDVSHELRSPLTRMKVALEMTPKGKHRDSMMRDIGEMETMLTEILETEHLKSDHGKLRLGPVDLYRLTKGMVQKYKDRKPGVRFLGRTRNLTVTADEARVRTVLQNVLENALKYSARQKKPVQVGFEDGPGIVIIVVWDFGPGIPAEDLQKVFEPFYRVDKSRTKQTGGYGLGLSLCQVIMRAHGGEIALESDPGQGTRVYLKFPRERTDKIP